MVDRVSLPHSSFSFPMVAYILVNLSALWFLVGVSYASLITPHSLSNGWLILVALFVALLLRYRQHPGWRRTLTCCFAGCLLGFLFTVTWRLHFYTYYNYGTVVHFTGVVIEPPDVRDAKSLLVVLPDSPLGEDVRHKPIRTPIRVHAERYPTFAYGDRLEIRGSLDEPKAFDNFNYPLFLERFHIFAEMLRPRFVKIISHNRGSPLMAHLYALRASTESYIQRQLPEPEASFLGGILLGEKRSIPADIQEALQNTGTVHLIVISGSNITVLLGILLYFLPFSQKRHQFYATVLIALFITLLSGAPASVLRGAMVACVSQYIKSRSRFPWPTPFLLFSAALLLLGNPLLLVADSGFQISFAAFAGLVYFSTPLQNYLERFRLIKRLPEAIQESITQSLAATLGISALSFKLFGQLSFIGLVVNPIALWTIESISLLGLLLVTLGWIPYLATLLKYPLWLCLHFTLTMILWAGQWKIGILHSHFSALTTILVYLGIAIIFVLRRHPPKLRGAPP